MTPISSEISPGPAEMLGLLDQNWDQVWMPLARAIKKREPVPLNSDVASFQNDPEKGKIEVWGPLVENGEVVVTPDDFKATIGPYLRGTPA